MRVVLLQLLKTVKIGPQLWKLTSPMIIHVKGVTYTVPTDFITDGASVPRPLWRIAPPMTGRHAEAAVLHDYLYSLDCKLYSTTSHEVADRIFLAAMKGMGTSLFVRSLIFAGVYAFGFPAFKRCYSKEKANEKTVY